MASGAGFGEAGALLGAGGGGRETAVVDDVPVVVQGGLDDVLLVNMSVHAEARVVFVAEGIREVALQVHSVQFICCNAHTCMDY